MNQSYQTELQAKETLKILSSYDHLQHWEDFNNLPKLHELSLKHKKAHSFSKERSVKHSLPITKAESGKSFKLQLIPKKPIFEQRTQSIKNERRNKQSLQNRKKIVSKLNTHYNTLENNPEVQINKNQLNLMRFWFQHRFQLNSMNNMIYRIAQKRKGMRSVLN